MLKVLGTKCLLCAGFPEERINRYLLPTLLSGTEDTKTK